MTRFLFVTLGSWGDLFPMIGVGRELCARGHQVKIAASPAWKGCADGTAIEYVPIGRDIGFTAFAANPEIFGRVPWGLRAALDRFLFSQAAELTNQLRPEIDSADVVVAHPAHVIALNLAEAARKRVVTLSVFPSMLPSAHTVPGGSPFGPWSGPIGRAANRVAWANARVATAALFDRRINRHRRSLGLPKVHAGLLTIPLNADATVLAVPPDLIDQPGDWPASVTVTGAVSWDRAAGSIDPELTSFLEAGAPPVLVTLGASSAAVADDFYELATKILSDLGERVVVVTGPAPPLSGLDPRIVIQRDFVSFAEVLPACRAVVHHGGVGTTVAAARAGLPQVAVPMGFDQPETAAMIERKRIGMQVPWRRRHQRLAHVIEQTLADVDIRNRAKVIGEAIRASDGTAQTADALEGVEHVD